MNIKKATKFHISFRTGSIYPIDHKGITAVLGFRGTQGDPDKVKREWRFTVDGIPCAIWDYKGSHKAPYCQYSCYMPAAIGKELFGDKFHSEDEYRLDVRPDV